jgi:AcrR family transcriptional regulator
MTATRTYNSPLREDQMELTRQRLLETVADMFADGIAEVTVATVAERAKVSVRTAYRYFPDKEAMFDAFNDWMGDKYGTPPLPTTIEELGDMGQKLIESFDRNEKLVRAARRSPAGAEARKRRKMMQVKSMSRVVADYAPHLDKAEVTRIVGVFLNLLGSEAWLAMRDTLGMTTPECIEAVRWGIAAVVAKIDHERPRKGRK